MTTSADRRPTGSRPNVGTLAALAVLTIGSVLFVRFGDAVLPTRISEGPLVQRPSERGATIIWYTSRPADCTFVLTRASGDETLPVKRTHTRHQVVIDGLRAASDYAYAIHCGGRVLADDSLHTNKPAGAPFRFIVFGDSGRAKREQFVLAERMRAVEPDFLLHTGDLVYPDGARRRYAARFFTPYRKLLGRIGFWPCLGNHDVDTAGAAEPYSAVFELPANGPAGGRREHHYWFDYADARVAVVDTDVSEAELRGQVAPWLRAVMSAESPRWRFVSFHHPPYTGGKYPPNLTVQQTLVPVIEETGVDVVFNGHDHNYQRIKPMWQGAPAVSGPSVRYVVTGAGGARLYQASADSPGAELVDKFVADRHSFSVVAIDGDTLNFQQIDIQGDVIDEWSLTKSTGTTQPAEAP